MAIGGGGHTGELVHKDKVRHSLSWDNFHGELFNESPNYKL